MTMPWRWCWRQLRTEILVFAALTVVAALAALGLAQQLSAIVAQSGCLGAAPRASGESGCAGVAPFISLAAVADPVATAVACLPCLAGLAFGCQVVARELEDGTARLAWLVEPTRVRWLAERVVVGLAVVVAISSVCAILGYLLAASAHPGVTLTQSFQAYGLWGPLIVARGVAAFMIAVAVGSLVGEVPGATAAAVVLAASMILGALIVARGTFPAEIWRDGTTGSADALIVQGGMSLTPAGTLVKPMEALSHAPAGLAETDPNAAAAWVDNHYPPASAVIPGGQVLAVEGREALLLIGIGTLSGVIAGTSVIRRSPG